MRLLLTGLSLVLASLVSFKAFPAIIKKELPLYLYSDFGEADRSHFYPVGKMGIKYDITLIENHRKDAYKGSSCIRIKYVPRKVLKSSWSGIYWLYPPNNWGKLPNTGYDLSEARKFVFYARGKRGREVASFKVGGIRGRYGDSCTVPLNGVQLSKEWQRYEINLEGYSLERIIGAFCISIESLKNERGAVIFLDELRFE